VIEQSTGIIVGVYDAIAGATANPGRSKYEFRFSWMPGLINTGTVYTIKVAFFNGTTGTWSPYGPGCDIETPTPTPTQLTSTFCNDSTIATIFIVIRFPEPFNTNSLLLIVRMGL
jgi:hypothetical protein